MIWNYFFAFALGAVICWALGAAAAWKDRRRVAVVATAVGLMVFFAYVVSLWTALELFLPAFGRPSRLRTLALQMDSEL